MNRLKTVTTHNAFHHLSVPDDCRLAGALSRFGHSVKTYDDGFGPLWIHRDSMGIVGIVRAQTWEEAFQITRDEFLHAADESDHAEAFDADGNERDGYTMDSCGVLRVYDINADYVEALTEKLANDLSLSIQTIPDEPKEQWFNYGERSAS